MKKVGEGKKYSFGNKNIEIYRHENENRWECYIFGSSVCIWIEGNEEKMHKAITEYLNEEVTKIYKEVEKIRNKASQLENIALTIKEKGLEKAEKNYQALQNKLEENK